MIKALIIGSIVIIVTMIIAAYAFHLFQRLLPVLSTRLHTRPGVVKSPILITVALMWILFVLTVSTWIWAAVYLALGLFETMETALYFALISFTTVGFGDVILAENWRLLSGMTATNGLLVFGLFTAFLVEILDVTRLQK